MAEYYLISQLPSLDGQWESSPLPISEERFTELCGRFLSKKASALLNGLTLTPDRYPEPTGSALIDRWNENERDLRLALATVRAAKLKKDFDTENALIPPEHIKAATTAAEAHNPMDAEKHLNRYRLELLEALRPADGFSEDYIFYYGLRLKLLQRIQCFDSAAGEDAYRNIYSSVINGDNQEAL